MILIVGKGVFLAWSLFAGVWDLKCRKVPNWWMLPGYLVGGLLTFTSLQDGGLGWEEIMIAAMLSGLSILYWSLRWWGGADAKFLIISALVFPTPGFVAAQIAGQAASAFAGRKAAGESFPAVLVMSISTILYCLAAALVPGS